MTIADIKKTAMLAGLRRRQLRFERYSCTNPRTSSALDNPTSHGRSGSTTTPRPAAEAAAAMPDGRQQATVDTALTPAATGVIFSAWFMITTLSCQPARLPTESLYARTPAMKL